MSLSGVMVLDKPADISSAQAVAKVKRLLGVKKAGHTGTLDPFATGVLICCVNKATRLAQFFLHGDKTYQAVMRLGIETDTQDATGQVTAQTNVPAISSNDIKEVFSGFEGRQSQLPPIFAALKHKGTPLYKLARKGKPIQKPARLITIFAIRITAINLPEIAFEVVCSSGTYVRTLCADIGKALGCGGHLIQLRRTFSSGFSIEQAVTLTVLEQMDPEKRLKNVVIPMNAALKDLPTLMAGQDILDRITHGQRLSFDQVNPDVFQRLGDKHVVDYLKVVDAELNLKAILKARSGETVYDYCCVFH